MADSVWEPRVASNEEVQRDIKRHCCEPVVTERDCAESQSQQLRFHEVIKEIWRDPMFARCRDWPVTQPLSTKLRSEKNAFGSFIKLDGRQ